VTFDEDLQVTALASDRLGWISLVSASTRYVDLVVTPAMFASEQSPQ
jgi:hypothetical protein